MGFFVAKSGKLSRALGWAWVLAAAVIVILSPHVYYLFPAFPVLFAPAARRLVRPLLDRSQVGLSRLHYLKRSSRVLRAVGAEIACAVWAADG
jgi:hypothetical protein